MKRRLAFLLACVLTIGVFSVLFAGCANDDDNKSLNRKQKTKGEKQVVNVPTVASDLGWHISESRSYQRYLKEHNIIQSMSRKGNCMDNGAMENFFGRLKVEMYYGEKFETVDEFVHRLKEYIDYWNNERISLKLKGMSPVQYRTHSHII